MMSRPQIFLTVVGVLLVVALYQLPRVVVKNEGNDDVDTHSFEISPDDQKAIVSLKNYLALQESENYINFADSLGRYYLKYGFLDSTRSITRQYLQRDSSLLTLKKAAVLLYSVFERAGNSKEVGTYAGEASELLTRIVRQEPNNLSAKSKLAMTLVTTKNPMAGIMLLREVIEEDPDNREALIDLGLLSIQSGQYEKGAERFEKVLSMDSADYEAMLYLGVCKLETAAGEDAKRLFSTIANAQDVDPALRVAAEEYLQRDSN